jgi:hypothetical protein
MEHVSRHVLFKTLHIYVRNVDRNKAFKGVGFAKTAPSCSLLDDIKAQADLPALPAAASWNAFSKFTYCVNCRCNIYN